jgi:pantetheine-phosphate adenylyltransferase
LIRGLRNSIDFQYEKDMAETNRLLWPDLQTIFVPTLPEYSCISSSVVRDLFRHGGDCSHFLPKGVNLK